MPSAIKGEANALKDRMNYFDLLRLLYFNKYAMDNGEQLNNSH